MRAALVSAMMPEIMQGSVCCQSWLRGGVCPACPACLCPWVHPRLFVRAVPEGQPSALQPPPRVRQNPPGSWALCSQLVAPLGTLHAQLLPLRQSAGPGHTLTLPGRGQVTSL